MSVGIANDREASSPRGWSTRQEFFFAGRMTSTSRLLSGVPPAWLNYVALQYNDFNILHRKENFMLQCTNYGRWQGLATLADLLGLPPR
jgi:hypothetical protein